MTFKAGDWIWAGHPLLVEDVKTVHVTRDGKPHERHIVMASGVRVLLSDTVRLCSPEEVTAAKRLTAIASFAAFFPEGWDVTYDDEAISLQRPDGVVLEIGVEGGGRYEPGLSASVRLAHVRVPIAP